METTDPEEGGVEWTCDVCSKNINCLKYKSVADASHPTSLHLSEMKFTCGAFECNQTLMEEYKNKFGEAFYYEITPDGSTFYLENNDDWPCGICGMKVLMNLFPWQYEELSKEVVYCCRHKSCLEQIHRQMQLKYGDAYDIVEIENIGALFAYPQVYTHF